MDIIVDPNIQFDFNNLLLTAPTVVSGGNHFIKCALHDNPVYIRTPKCKIKQAVIKTGKKIYCDLLFTNEHEEFIQWMENLENYSQQFIFNKREKWFETNLEKHDIENSFTSPMKIYKSGKFYILRCMVPTVLGKSDLKIYDENENILDIDNLQENTPVVSVLEIQGIKCSPRGFQIDIEIKQLLVLKPKNLFDKCILLKTGANLTLPTEFDQTHTMTKSVVPTDPQSEATQEFEESREPLYELKNVDVVLAKSDDYNETIENVTDIYDEINEEIQLEEPNMENINI
jgi:hypothetical protein